ncbi:MAG: hypothetical protein GM46_9250 [actinobacterium acAcidi]|nr:MAG: hypothetical protein GM46_9250 [actinobacterium acAcidi]
MKCTKHSTENNSAGDRGSALLMVLILMTVGSIIAVGLLTYARVLLDTRPALHEQNAAAEAVKSGTRMAIALQRDFGPSACFAASTNWTLNGYNVNSSCTTVTSYATGANRYGTITTLNAGTTADISTPSWAGSMATALTGNILVNTGTSADPLSSNLINDGSTTWNNTAQQWWQMAGDNPSGTSWVYPQLPQIPSFQRPGSQATIGTCSLYFPGRYVGTTPLTLNGGAHYFASGVYYFERPLVIAGSAQVVFGEGSYAGCAVDAQAAYASTAPKSHEITGKGATLLLGGGASLTVQESSVRFNRRVSTSTTRGSEGVSIRTVNFGQSNSSVVIPADTVLLPDGSTTSITAHSIIPVANATPVAYVSSTLAPSTSWGVDVRLNGTSSFANRFLVDGYIFVPNTGIRATSTTAAYEFGMTGGVVATKLQLALTLAPSKGTTAYTVGVISQTIQRKVRLAVSTTDGIRHAVSTAVVEVHADKSYAINSWVVDP